MAGVLTADILRDMVHYDPDTGIFTRRVRSSNRVRIGDVIGSPSHYGYLVAHVNGALCKMHRLAYLYMTGSDAIGQIDHINGDRSDNRWANLRVASNRMNQQNLRSARSNNRCGLLGVSRHKSGKWVSRIKVDGQARHLGLFNTAEDAHQAYLEAKRRLHEGCTI